MIKLCVFCEHCLYNEAIEYSELTYEAEYWSCTKDYWSYKELEAIRGETGFEIAMKCPDFKLSDELTKLINRVTPND